MLKIAGIVLIVGAFTGIGISQRQRFRCRVSVLGEMLSVLDIISGELTFHLTSIPEIVEKLSKDRRTAVSAVFGAMQASMQKDDGLSLTYKWMKAFREHGKEAGLHEEDIGVLCDLSDFIGRYDAKAQQQSIAFARERLMENLQTASAELKSKGMVYRSCCIAAGILLVLVLI